MLPLLPQESKLDATSAHTNEKGNMTYMSVSNLISNFDHMGFAPGTYLEERTYVRLYRFITIKLVHHHEVKIKM